MTMIQVKPGYWKIGKYRWTYLAKVSSEKPNGKLEYETLKFETGKMEIKCIEVGHNSYWPGGGIRISEKEYFLTKLRGYLTEEQKGETDPLQ